ncbi:hypothetical protein CAC42_3073 [Sphaceloma murrayae]|uniref:Uncharacterized protein n=1 Tax=Sphaceloma murrayae TaxID=2082308 RepID=A0A2K1QRG6_9PEZI|nr:hypothetical protein CAC42_3073 [Sphaceloma murrayae]
MDENDSAAPSAASSSKPPLPSLCYNALTPSRIRFMVLFWLLVIIDSVFMPIGLYFGLEYGTSLSPNTVFSIVTAAIGGVSIIEYFLRTWRLWKRDSTCRPIGGGRWGFDFFQWMLTGAWLIMMVELIVGSTPDQPPIRLLAMPPATLLFCFGTQLVVFEGMRLVGRKMPVRVSSRPRGSDVLPGVYYLVEDIVSVDGSGGTAYRERLWERHKASRVFRAMLDTVTLFWAVGSIGMATLTTALVFTLHRDYAYAVGWSAPFVWAGLWAGMTWWYVNGRLRVERDTWDQVDRL